MNKYQKTNGNGEERSVSASFNLGEILKETVVMLSLSTHTEIRIDKEPSAQSKIFDKVLSNYNLKDFVL